MGRDHTWTTGNGFPELDARGLPPVSRSRIRLWTIFAISLLALLNGADYVTTQILLGRKAVEGNPLAGVLLSRGGLLWTKLALIGVIGILAIRSRPKLGALLIAWAAVGVYVTAVLSNLLSLRMA